MIPRSLLRFGATGAGATAVHAAVVFVAVKAGGWSYAAANFVAAGVAMLFSWWVNTTWSFGQVPSARNAARFLAVAAFGALLAAGVGEAAERLGLGLVAGIAMVVAIVTPVTYLLHRFWTFRG